MNIAQATTIANQFLETLSSKNDLKLYKEVEEFDVGWLFTYNHKSFFDSRVQDIVRKIGQLKKEVGSEELESHLTKEELELELKSVGLVGNSPIFVDLAGECELVHHLNVESFLQKKREAKYGIKFGWNIYLTVPDVLALKKLKAKLDLTNQEVLDIKNKSERKLSSINTNCAGKLKFFQNALEEVGIKYEVEEYKC